MSKNSLDGKEDALLSILVLYTKLFHKPYTADTLVSGLPSCNLLDDSSLFYADEYMSLFSRAAQKAGLKSTMVKKELKDILQLQLPMILLLKNKNACILEEFSTDGKRAKIIYSEGEGLSDWIDLEKLDEEYLGFGYLLKKEFRYKDVKSHTLRLKQKDWFWSTLKLSTKIYRDVLIASLLVNIFVLATPLFTMNVYDRVIPNNAQDTLRVFAIGIVVVYLLDFFLKFTRAYMLELAGKKSDIVMSSIIFEKVMDLKMSSHPSSVGSFASNLRDFEAVRSFFTTATMTALIDLPFSFIFLIAIYYIGGMLVFVPITTMILILSYALFIRKPLQDAIESSHEASARKNSILIETLQNIETVKTMGMSGKIQWKWEDTTGEIANKNLKSRIMSASIPNITNLFIQLNTVFVVVFGVYLIEKFDLTMGGLIAVVILTSRTIAPMGQAAALITNYSDAKTSYKILSEIISRPAERPHDKEFIEIPQIKGKIEFKNVSFTYPNAKLPSLDRVSFTIKPGEKVAIVGRIGSGKTTIAKLLLKLYEPTEGMILIDDIDISQIDSAKLRSHIGYVPQDIHLFGGTIKENIISSERHPSDREILHAVRVSGAEDFIKTHPMGFDMPIGERGAGLSGGQRQSVGIARAILQDSPIMVMDEPSNAMDQTTENNLLKRFKSEFKHKTMILITQKFSLLNIVNRVIVLHDAKIILDGNRDSVITKLSGESKNG